MQVVGFAGPLKSALLVQVDRCQEKVGRVQEHPVIAASDGKPLQFFHQQLSDSKASCTWKDGHAPDIETALSRHCGDGPDNGTVENGHPDRPIIPTAQDVFGIKGCCGESAGSVKVLELGEGLVKDVRDSRCLVDSRKTDGDARLVGAVRQRRTSGRRTRGRWRSARSPNRSASPA